MRGENRAYHGFGVASEVDGVCEPGDAEFEFAFCGFDILGVFWVPWIDGITYTASQYLIFQMKEDAYHSA